MNLYQIILFFLLLNAIATVENSSVQLHQNWKMIITQCPNQYSSFIGKQFNVSVPSTIHLNLQKYNQIPNPYFGKNLEALASLSDCSAKFTTTFQVGQESNQYSNSILRFQGIDTYSTVYLNDVKLGSTQNAFLLYQFDVKSHLKIGNNQLVVQIKSTKSIDYQRQKNDRMPFDYAQTRKACYQYSWDWAPYMNSAGIWLPVSLIFYKQAKFQYVWIRNKEISERKAVLDFTCVLDGIQDQSKIQVQNLQIKVVNKNTKQALRFKIKSKYNSLKVIIKQPILWWPNNIGQPYVYQYQLLLLKKDEVLDTKHMVYGIRTVKLDSEGTNFQIIVNGYPIYCKGANYVPPDMMYPRLINKDFKPANTYQNLLNDALESNFNMIRVWGGGQYQTDQFYEMASRKGIMIFQDFMFSDSIYPGTDQFLENVKKEVIYQVRRLRNYPAIVLWSGNNQILQGIISWGWGQPRYQQNYRKLFKQLIPDILNIECNYIPYIQSSPSRGVGNGGFQSGGDVHYWGVWASASPFQNYQTAIGGFNSQFGTQSLPVWQTIFQFTDTNGRHYQSDQLLFHQKHSSKFNTLRGYIARYSKQSINFELQTYNSGLVQAYGIQIAIRAQRCSKPKSFGTLYWQFNDAWPSISWSSIDYYGRWKPLQYLAKEYFKDIILFYHPHSGKFIAINDKLTMIKANFNIKLMKFDGQVLYEDRGSLDLSTNQKRQLGVLEARLFSGLENQALVYTSITYGEHEDNKTILITFFRPFKDLELNPTTLFVKYIYEKNQIILTSKYLIKNLYISSSRQYLKLSDNYFDLVPDHPKKIKIINPPVQLHELKQSLIFKSYREIFDPSSLPVKVEN